MTTVRQYTATMRTSENQVALQSGVNLPAETQTIRVVQTGGLAMTGTLCKLLVDKGILTDAELLAALNAAVAEPWPGEPVVNLPAGP